MSRKAFETRIQSNGKHKGQPTPCECCDQPGTHWIRWAFSPFRGEDETTVVCERHNSMAMDPVQRPRFWAHYRTKEQFVARRQAPQAEAP